MMDVSPVKTTHSEEGTTSLTRTSSTTPWTRAMAPLATSRPFGHLGKGLKTSRVSAQRIGFCRFGKCHATSAQCHAENSQVAVQLPSPKTSPTCVQSPPGCPFLQTRRDVIVQSVFIGTFLCAETSHATEGSGAGLSRASFTSRSTSCVFMFPARSR